MMRKTKAFSYRILVVMIDIIGTIWGYVLHYNIQLIIEGKNTCHVKILAEMIVDNMHLQGLLQTIGCMDRLERIPKFLHLLLVSGIYILFQNRIIMDFKT